MASRKSKRKAARKSAIQAAHIAENLGWKSARSKRGLKPVKPRNSHPFYR